MFEQLGSDSNPVRKVDTMSQIALSVPAAPFQRITLTRRGRLVLLVTPLVLLATLVLFVIGGFLQPANASSSVSGPGASIEEVTVMEGDTLWGLARQYAPQRDARDVVAEIGELNSLSGPLQAGQTLTVPTAGGR